MAYGLKYTSTFHQLKSYSTTGEWLIEIFLEGYGGSVTEFKTARNSLKLKRTGKFSDVIRPTTLDIGAENQSEGQFIEFSTAKWGDYKVVLTFDPNGAPITKYVGYNQTEIYTEEFGNTGGGIYTTSLKFTDGLKHLEYIRWRNEGSDLTESAINTNSTASVSASIGSTDINGVIVNINAETGTHALHVVHFQTSPDDAVWTDTEWSIVGINSTTITDISANFIRLKVTTAEGGTSTVKWSIKPIYTGQKALIETLRLALNKLPSPLGVRDIVNVYEDSINAATSDSMLAQIFTDAEMYKEEIKENGQDSIDSFMCNRVIEEVLKPLYCQIYQSNGLWYIVRKQEYKGANLVFRQFTASVGSEGSLNPIGSGTLAHKRTITNKDTATTDIIMPAASAEKEVIPPTNRLKLTYNQQNLDFEESNIIDNPDFSDWTTVNNPNRVPNKWGYFGVDPSSYNIAPLSQNYYLNEGFQFDPSDYNLATVRDLTKYIFQSKTGVPTATSDIIRLSFDAIVRIRREVTGSASNGSPTAVFANWISSSVTVTNDFTIRIGQYYLAGDNISGYSWTTSQQNIAKIIIKGSNNASYGAIEFTKYIHYYDINFSIDLPTLPQNGVFSWYFGFFQTYTDVPSYNISDPDYTVTLDSVFYKNISAIYLPDEVNPETEQILYADINEDENVEEIEVIHGDGGTTISQGSYRLASGVITDAWQRRGESESLPILTILINSIRDDNGDFKDQLNAKLIGEFEPHTTFSMLIGAVTKIYIFDNYTYNIETNEWECTLIEAETFVLDVKIVNDKVLSTQIPPTKTPAPIGTNNGVNTFLGTPPTMSMGTLNIENASQSTAEQNNLTNYN